VEDVNVFCPYFSSLSLRFFVATVAPFFAMNTHPENFMEKLVSLCKRRGFIFPSSEIYGGLNGVWDYGPMGVELKRNLKEFWWRRNVRERDDVVGMDGAILMNRSVWQASGHESTFSDPMVDCKTCKGRFRADQLDTLSCPMKPSKKVATCDGEKTEPRDFNLMFSTHVGPMAEESNKTYLRPETAQAIFVQFRNVLETSRQKLPFGIAQIGKAFRNEINPRNFIFRSREFEQMEIEYFCRPDTGMQLLDYWLEERLRFYEDIGIPRSKIRINEIPDGERAFYSLKTYDLEYAFPFGIQELEGIAYRTDYDLKQHTTNSGKQLDYFDEERQEKFIPHVIEPSAGADRTLLALLCEAFEEQEITDHQGNKEIRTVLHFHPRMAPIKVGVFPLLKNRPALVEKAQSITRALRPYMTVFYDEAGAIGRRYRRQDEIGTPFCVTIDFETLDENNPNVVETVTLRERDSMEQRRIPIAELQGYLMSKIF
jgi:glycyl-tRNA synthetase